jgi:hypothetical protein
VLFLALDKMVRFALPLPMQAAISLVSLLVAYHL